jgi:hypothetical protein
MPDLGNFVEIDMDSVKSNADKATKYLKDKLSKRTSNHSLVVVFLGETHGNAVDRAVTQAMLTSPPIVHPGHSRVLFERQLGAGYVCGASFESEREERIDLSLSRKARSKLIADMVLDLFENGDTLIYIPCGSAHSREIYDALNKRAQNPFTYICKMSSTD